MAKAPTIHAPIGPAPAAVREGPGSGGVTGKGWQPGQSGNPGGRPKGAADYIRSQTAEGQELVDHALHTLRNPRAPWKAREGARQDLLAYLWGRPPQAVKLNLEGQQPIYIFPPGTDPRTADAELPPPAVQTDEHGEIAVTVPE